MSNANITSQKQLTGATALRLFLYSKDVVNEDNRTLVCRPTIHLLHMFNMNTLLLKKYFSNFFL